MDYDSDSDGSCYTVHESTFDYEELDWENLTVQDCNCSNLLHTYLSVCEGVCEPPTLKSPDFTEVAIPGFLYLVVFLVGTVGNALVIFVVNRFRRMRTVTNIFLAALSTADLCLIWICVPIMFVKFMSYAWFMGRFACYSVHYVQQFTCFCSVLTMTMISFERYMAIAYPMRSRWLSSIGRAKKAIAIIWTVSAFLAIPSAVRIDYNHSNSLNGERVYWCMREFPQLFGSTKKTLNRAFALYQLLLLIAFPVATMTVCYFRVAVLVCKSSKGKGLTAAVVAFSRAATDAATVTGYSTLTCDTALSLQNAAKAIKYRKSNRVAENNKKQIVKMLIAIVVVYTLCRTPTIVDELLTSFGYICRPSNTATLKAMRMGFNALAYCQSCINPICYAFMSQNFRATFKSAYKRMRLRSQASGEMRKRLYSSSSVSMSISSRYRRYRNSHFTNTLTVPNADSFITPNMSRDVSQLSLSRPLTPNRAKLYSSNMSRDASVQSFFERLSHVRSKFSYLPSETSREPSQYSLSKSCSSAPKDYLSINSSRDASQYSLTPSVNSSVTINESLAARPSSQTSNDSKRTRSPTNESGQMDYLSVDAARRRPSLSKQNLISFASPTQTTLVPNLPKPR